MQDLLKPAQSVAGTAKKENIRNALPLILIMAMFFG